MTTVYMKARLRSECESKRKEKKIEAIVFPLRLDSQSLINLALMHSVPLFYACPPFMNTEYILKFFKYNG